MKYAIMSRLVLEGLQIGHFDELDSLFLEEYEEVDEGHVVAWTAYLADVLTLDTEEAAWRLARDIWGTQFAETNIYVVSFAPAAFNDSVDRTAEQIKKAKKERQVQQEWDRGHNG